MSTLGRPAPSSHPSDTATSIARPKPTCDREVTESLAAPFRARDFDRENRA